MFVFLSCNSSAAVSLFYQYALNVIVRDNSVFRAVSRPNCETTSLPCPTYENQCYVLKNASGGLVTSDILGTKDGVEANEFLRATNTLKKQSLPIPPKVPPM